MSSGIACAVEILAAQASLKPLPVPLLPLPVWLPAPTLSPFPPPLPAVAVALAPAAESAGPGRESELLPQATQFQLPRNSTPIPTATSRLRGMPANRAPKPGQEKQALPLQRIENIAEIWMRALARVL